MTRWNLNIPEDTDRDVRVLLAKRGAKKGDLSKFVTDALRREILRETVDEIRESFSELTPEEAQELADEAVAWARANRS